jgi:ankyrin repeat protein
LWQIADKWNTAWIFGKSKLREQGKRMPTLAELFAAIDRNDLTKITEYVESGIKLNELYNGTTAINYALKKRKVEIALHLIATGVRLDVVDAQGLSPLHICAETDDLIRVTLAILNEARTRGMKVVNRQSEEAATPLHVAARAGQLGNIRVLLSYGAHPNAYDNGFYTPLGLVQRFFAEARDEATARSALQAINTLLEHGADPDALQEQTYSPLHIALMHCSAAKFATAHELVLEMLGCLLHYGTIDSLLLAAPIRATYYPIEGAASSINHNATPAEIAMLTHHVAMQTLLHAKLFALPAGTALIEAVKANDIGKIRESLTMAINLSDTDVYGRTALHWAAAKGHYRALAILLDHGADVTMADMHGNTALHLCILRGHLRAVSPLLECGADFMHSNAKGESPFNLLSIRMILMLSPVILRYLQGVSHEEAAECLLNLATTSVGKMTALSALPLQSKPLNSIIAERSYDVTHQVEGILNSNVHIVDTLERDKKGYTPLHLAVYYGLSGVARALIKGGALLSVTTNLGRTPVMVAARLHNTALLTELANEGADLIECGQQHNNLFHHLLLSEDNLSETIASINALIALLTHRGVNVSTLLNAANAEGVLPLAAAIEHEIFAKELVDILLKNGASVRNLAAGVKPPLYVAAEFGKVEIAETMMATIPREETVAWINGECFDHCTPLHAAISRNQDAMLRWLLVRGADPNARPRDKGDDGVLSPLEAVAFKGRLAQAKLLRKYGAHVTSQNSGGNSPLHLAAMSRDQFPVAVYLMVQGANLDLLNAQGKTPAAVAKEHGNRQLVRLIEQAKALPAGSTLWHHAVETGDSKLLEQLYAVDPAGIDTKDAQGNTPLHIAIQNKKDSTACFLISRNASLASKNAEMKTPLEYANKAMRDDLALYWPQVVTMLASLPPIEPEATAAAAVKPNKKKNKRPHVASSATLTSESTVSVQSGGSTDSHGSACGGIGFSAGEKPAPVSIVPMVSQVKPTPAIPVAKLADKPDMPTPLTLPIEDGIFLANEQDETLQALRGQLQLCQQNYLANYKSQSADAQYAHLLQLRDYACQVLSRLAHIHHGSSNKLQAKALNPVREAAAALQLVVTPSVETSAYLLRIQCEYSEVAEYDVKLLCRLAVLAKDEPTPADLETTAKRLKRMVERLSGITPTFALLPDHDNTIFSVADIAHHAKLSCIFHHEIKPGQASWGSAESISPA